jgi:hypothetical protein
MTNRAKWIWVGICAALLIIMILVEFFGTKILVKAGQFMAPQGDYSADVAILEGCDFLGEEIDVVIINAINLLFSRKVKRLIVVLHSTVLPKDYFGVSKDYPSFVKGQMEKLGLTQQDFSVVISSAHHPTTLIVARVVVEALSKEKVKTAILLSHGFHTRRSYLVYQYESLPFQIKIFPFACLNSYQPLNNWWSHSQGRFYFSEEALKLLYYFAMGYIPLKVSY